MSVGRCERHGKSDVHEMTRIMARVLIHDSNAHKPNVILARGDNNLRVPLLHIIYSNVPVKPEGYGRQH